MRLRLVILLASVLALVAAASSAAQRSAAGNRLAAQRDAARLLERVVLPSGTQSLPRAPRGAGGLLTGPFQVPTGKLVDLHRFWRVSEPLDSVVRFVRAHRPRGAQREGSGVGSVGGPSYPENETLTFAFPPQANRTSLRWLNVTLVALRDGGTGVRADAQEIWIVPRPRSEVVPAGVSEIDIGSHHVGDGAKVARIVHWFDALPTVQPGLVSCPMLVAGPTIRLVFRGGAGVLARASFGADTIDHSLYSGRCTPIRFSIGDRREKALVGGRFLLRVQRLLGAKLL